jgi:hypothetical protein
MISIARLLEVFAADEADWKTSETREMTVFSLELFGRFLAGIESPSVLIPKALLLTRQFGGIEELRTMVEHVLSLRRLAFGANPQREASLNA